MKIFSKIQILGIVFVAFIFVACNTYTPRVVEATYTLDESAKFGFNFAEDSDIKNPPIDKARVFIVRERKSIGRPYYIFYQYDPTMDENNKPINEKDKYKDNLIGLLTRKGSVFVRDFEPNRVLMFKKNLSYT